MPVARIVSRNLDRESPALRELTDRLHAAGYEVEFASTTGGEAPDLLVEADQMPAGAALDAALRAARETEADVFVAPGLFGGEQNREVAHDQSAESVPAPALPSADTPEADSDIDPPVVDARYEDGPGVLADVPHAVGTAAGESRRGLADSIADLRARAAQAWTQMRQRRAEAAEALRLERERSELQLAERRRLQQLELQRRAEEQQRIRAERERAAVEQQRILREDMARQAAVLAERQRVEQAEAAERERHRVAAVEAERLRAGREQEIQRAAALAAQRARLERQADLRPAPPTIAIPRSAPRPAVQVSTAAAEPARKAAPVTKPALTRPARPMPSPRERQWQRAALIASLATLAAMLGFGLAARLRPASPLPASLTGGDVQQQVPFGPAGASSKSVTSASADASAPSAPGIDKHGGIVANRPVIAKPSPAKPVPTRNSRRQRGAGNDGAGDEVIVRRFPTSHVANSHAQRAQTTSDGVRHYSDEN